MKLKTPIASLLLLVFFLASSIGVPVSKHFCRGELKDIGIFSEAKDCRHENRMPICPLHAPALPDKDQKDCCQDTRELIKTAPEEIEFLKSCEIHFFTGFLYAAWAPETTIERSPFSPTTYSTYNPPPLIANRTIVFQSFLI